MWLRGIGERKARPEVVRAEADGAREVVGSPAGSFGQTGRQCGSSNADRSGVPDQPRPPKDLGHAHRERAARESHI